MLNLSLEGCPEGVSGRVGIANNTFSFPTPHLYRLSTCTYSETELYMHPLIIVFLWLGGNNYFYWKEVVFKLSGVGYLRLW
jgi:hypothetical protein